MEDRLVYLVPYAHLDTQWRWEYPTTITKYLRSTLTENLRLFRLHPEYEFNFTGAIRYAMMREYYPELFERAKELISEGRWHLAGTCLDETDTIVPSVESMLRNVLYGDRWQKREFGRSSRDTLLPDCFGFPANMPTVLAHAGIVGFSTQKLKWGSAVGIPFEIGMWRGPDGSEVASALNPGMYVSHLPLPVHLNPARLTRLRRLGNKNGVWKSFQYYGVGDIGGAPSEGSVKRAQTSMRHGRARQGRIQVRQGASDRFFSELTEEEQGRLDRYEGDLLLTEHSAGTLTSAAIMKRWNRRNEQLAFAAEAASVAAVRLAGLPYPRERIEATWWRLIGSQMHDILPGTCTPTAYNYAQNDEVLALNIWTEIVREAAESIAPHLPGSGELLLFNPCPEERNDVVEIDAPTYLEETDVVVVRDETGHAYAGQLCVGSEGARTLVFAPRLEGLSWRRFAVEREARRGDAPASTVRVEHTEGAYALVSDVYRVEVRDDGAVSSIVDLRRELELLSRPLAYELQRERPAGYPAWNMYWRDRRRSPSHQITGGATVELIERGPVRVGLRTAVRFGDSVFTREIRLATGSDLVELTERIDWRETGYSLKIAVSTRGRDPKVTTNWETCHIERPVNGPKAYEFPSRYWADLGSADGSISIIENCKYGYDRPKPATLRMTLLYTPALRTIGAFRDQGSQDWGRHTIRFALRSHHDDLIGSDQAARRFNQPTQAFLLGAVTGSRALAGRTEPHKPADAKEVAARTRLAAAPLLRLSDRRLGVLAVKRAEDASGILIRLYNRSEEEIAATIEVAFPVVGAWKVNGLEERLGRIPVEGDSVTVSVGASGLCSFVAEVGGWSDSRRPEVMSLSLPLDSRLFGRVEESLDSAHPLLPVELMPDLLSCGRVEFELAGGEGANAVRCTGQHVELPGAGSRLSLLAAAIEETDARLSFTAADGRGIAAPTCHVGAVSGFVGQWDRRIWKRSPRHAERLRRDYVWLNRCVGIEHGLVNRASIAWFATHTHESGADRPYQLGYLYRIDLEIPVGSVTVELPDDPRVYVVAATISNPSVRAEAVRALSDAYDF